MSSRRSSTLLILTAILSATLLVPGFAVAQNADSYAQEGLAPTPPMGWANWNRYFCDYDDQTIRQQADALVSSGMRDLGYKYLIIQECIAPSRDAEGNLMVDAKRFPHGIKALVDYIHDKGLKAGIYTDIGPYTCFPNPRYQGSYQHEDQDATTFASWGIDLVEMDYCNKSPEVSGRQVYEKMASAIRKTGRPMLFYICSWGNERPWEWAQGKAQLWRTDFDISLERNRVEWDRMVRNFKSNAQHEVFSGPHSWNDPDMLEVGNLGLTSEEAKTHFSMWAISAAPLWAGTDVASMDVSSRATLTNREVISIDQDPLGAGASRVGDDREGIEVWTKPLGSRSSGEYAVLLVNLRRTPETVGVRWSDLGLQPNVVVRDLWTHKTLGNYQGGYSASLRSHESRLLKVSGKLDWQKGAVFEAEWPGNITKDATQLIECGECSKGYAVQLGGSGQLSGEMAFPRITATADESDYSLDIFYVRNGLGDKKITVQVNDNDPIPLNLQMRVWNWARMRVKLQKGFNRVKIQYSGADSVTIDKIKLTQGAID